MHKLCLIFGLFYFPVLFASGQKVYPEYDAQNTDLKLHRYTLSHNYSTTVYSSVSLGFSYSAPYRGEAGKIFVDVTTSIDCHEMVFSDPSGATLFPDWTGPRPPIEICLDFYYKANRQDGKNSFCIKYDNPVNGQKITKALELNWGMSDNDLKSLYVDMKEAKVFNYVISGYEKVFAKKLIQHYNENRKTTPNISLTLQSDSHSSAGTSHTGGGTYSHNSSDKQANSSSDTGSASSGGTYAMTDPYTGQPIYIMLPGSDGDSKADAYNNAQLQYMSYEQQLAQIQYNTQQLQRGMDQLSGAIANAWIQAEKEQEARESAGYRKTKVAREQYDKALEISAKNRKGNGVLANNFVADYNGAIARIDDGKGGCAGFYSCKMLFSHKSDELQTDYAYYFTRPDQMHNDARTGTVSLEQGSTFQSVPLITVCRNEKIYRFFEDSYNVSDYNSGNILFDKKLPFIDRTSALFDVNEDGSVFAIQEQNFLDIYTAGDAGFKRVKSWFPDGGKEYTILYMAFQRGTDNLWCIVPKGRKNILHIYNTTTRKEIYKGDMANDFMPVFVPSKTVVYFKQTDGKLVSFDFGSGKILQTYDKFPGNFIISKGGTLALSMGADKKSVAVFDLASMKYKFYIPSVSLELIDETADDKIVLAASSDHILFYDSEKNSISGWVKAYFKDITRAQFIRGGKAFMVFCNDQFGNIYAKEFSLVKNK